MEGHLEAIRAAVAPDATPEVRAAGAHACRGILAALETSVAPSATDAGSVPGSSPAAQVAQLLGSLRGMPADQLLDLAISHLRRMMPANAAGAPVQPIRFQIVPLPALGPGRSP